MAAMLSSASLFYTFSLDSETCCTSLLARYKTWFQLDISLAIFSDHYATVM